MPELRWSEYDFIECLGVLPIMQGIDEADVYKCDNEWECR